MKVLFQGGWKAGRNPVEVRRQIEDYCRSFATHLAKSQHQLVLASTRESDSMLATEVMSQLRGTERSPKDALLYLLSSRYPENPEHGRIHRFDQPRWWLEERTFLVEKCDAVVAIGGGRGTVDCIQKALLAGKPVFVAGAVPGASTEVWKKRPDSYHYISAGDADFTSDLNITAEEFFREVFGILGKLGATRYSRRIFIVHGHDHQLRDALAMVLRQLGFEPIVLQSNPGKGRTIIENIEQESATAGFAFILYTPDDLGRLKTGQESPRARQNVIFEHGILTGILSRDRICALVKGDVELPSDVQGLIYESVGDLAHESLRIARVLKYAGYQVDVSTLV